MQQLQQDPFREWVNGLPVTVATFKTLREQEEMLRKRVRNLRNTNPEQAAESSAKLMIVESRLDRLAIVGCDETLSSCYSRSGMYYNPMQMRWVI